MPTRQSQATESINRSHPFGSGLASLGLLVLALALSSCGEPQISSVPGGQGNSAAAANGDAKQDKNATGETEGPAGSQEVTQPALDVQGILRRSCDSCHGAGGTSSGGLKNITVLSHLVAAKYVIPGDPKASKLFMRIDDGSMPPPGGKALTAEEKATVESWIANGAEVTRSSTFEREQMSLLGDVIGVIQSDFEQLNANERRQARYLTAWPIWNLEVSEDEITDLQQGLSKFINSVSMSAKLVAPAKIDAKGGVYRIFLSNYRWSTDRWKLATDRETLFRHHPAAATLRAQIGDEVPVMRIDEFVASNAIAPMYYNLQNLQPNFTEFLKVDVQRADLSTIYSEVASGSANLHRLGFNDSQVADFSRIIERHAKPGSASFWMSHEFGSQDPDQDPFQRPLGPAQLAEAIGPASSDSSGVSAGGIGGASLAFRPNGHEIIFEKSNGMLGFFVALTTGERINEAPSGVRDSTNSSAEIPVGASCMACHYEGVIPKQDSISKAFDSKSLPGAAKTLFDLIYKTDLSVLFKSDRSLYQNSLAAIGVDHDREDPIHRIFKSFNKNATRREVAEILGVSDVDFEAAVKQLPSSVQGAWNALLAPNGQVARKNVTDHLEAALTGSEVQSVSDEERAQQRNDSLQKILKSLEGR